MKICEYANKVCAVVCNRTVALQGCYSSIIIQQNRWLWKILILYAQGLNAGNCTAAKPSIGNQGAI